MEFREGPDSRRHIGGGYEVQTKEELRPRDGLLCVHCSLILREAMQTEDGDRVCLSCYQEVKYVFP